MGIINVLRTTAVAVALSVSGASAADLKPINFGTQWVSVAGQEPRLTTPLGYAIELGIAQPILAEYGYSVGEQIGFGGTQSAAALENGSIQVANTGDTPAVLIKGNGQDTRVVLITPPNSDLWIVARADHGVKSLADLAGRKIGVFSNSNFEKYGLAALSRGGVVDQVERINLLLTDSYAALLRGDIDAVVTYPQQANAWVEGDKNLVVIDRARDGDLTLEAIGSVYTAQQSFLAENPKFQDALWAANVAGQKAVLDNPQAYIKWVATATGSTPEAVGKTLFLKYSDQPIAPEGVATLNSTIEFLKSRELIGNVVNVDEWVLR